MAAIQVRNLKRPNCVNFIQLELEHSKYKTSPEIFHVRIARLENKLSAKYTKHNIRIHTSYNDVYLFTMNQMINIA